MASILLISSVGEGIPLGLKLSQEGNICKLFINDLRVKPHLNGSKNLSVIQDPIGLLEQFDLVVITSPGIGHYGEECKAKGIKVLGGLFQDKLVMDEEYPLQVRDILYPGSSSKIEDSIPVAVTGWFDGENFLFSYLTINYDRFLNQDRGPYANSGSVCRLLPDSKISSLILTPMQELLTKVDFLGPITVPFSVYKESFSINSFIPFIDSSFFPFLELVKSSVWEVLWKVIQKDPNIFLRREETSIGVSLSVPPYPYTHLAEKTLSSGYLKIPDPARSHTYIFPETTNGYLGCVTARGDGINEARRRAYRTISNIVVSDFVQYRTDIGHNSEDIFNLLKEWGWLDNAESGSIS